MVMDLQKVIEEKDRVIACLHSARQNDIVILHSLIKRLGGEVVLGPQDFEIKNEGVEVSQDGQTIRFKIVNINPTEYDKDGKPIFKV